MKSGGKLDVHMHDHGWLSGSIYINVPPKLETDSGNLIVCIDDQVSELKKNINLKKNYRCRYWKFMSFSIFFISLYSSI